MSLQSVSFSATADDVREARRVLASWSLDKYLAVREEQRAKGEAPRDLVWLRHNATLEEALQTLSMHKILSAPILDAYSGDFLGFFGLGDLLKWLLKGLYPTLLNTELNTPEAMQEYIKQAPPNLNLNNCACRHVALPLIAPACAC
jgi:CBS-domain-containing membrane protein